MEENGNSVFHEVKARLGKPYHDLEFLLECFKEVLIENNEHELVNLIPWINPMHEIRPDFFPTKN